MVEIKKTVHFESGGSLTVEVAADDLGVILDSYGNPDRDLITGILQAIRDYENRQQAEPALMIPPTLQVLGIEAPDTPNQPDVPF